MLKAIFVVGPTATGKTKLALDIALKFNISICNMDSRQVYTDMEIGTNQGLSEYNILKEKNIYLKSYINPKQEYSLFQYLEDVIPILSKEKILIFEGGTGLYMDAMINKYKLSRSSNNKILREKLNNNSLGDLIQKVKKLDKYSSLNNSDKNNPRRLIRIIEKHNNNNNKIIKFPILIIIKRAYVKKFFLEQSIC